MVFILQNYKSLKK